MSNYRQQLSGILSAVTVCPACPPPPQTCGSVTSIPSGSQGYYNLDFDAGTTASDIGAVIVYFNPVNVPDGIRVEHDGAYYNTVTNNTSGRIQTTSGFSDSFTILGNPSDSCMPSSYPSTTSYDFFNGILNGAWNNTGTQQSITIQTGDYQGGGTNMWNTLVIPKTSQAVGTVSIQVLGHCATGWNVEVNCPVALPSVLASAPGATNLCQATQTTPMYFARNQGDSNTVPGLYNFVFSDENGANPLNPTATPQFYISGSTAYEVVEGVVVSSVTCT